MWSSRASCARACGSHRPSHRRSTLRPHSNIEQSQTEWRKFCAARGHETRIQTRCVGSKIPCAHAPGQRPRPVPQASSPPCGQYYLCTPNRLAYRPETKPQHRAQRAADPQEAMLPDKPFWPHNPYAEPHQASDCAKLIEPGCGTDAPVTVGI